MTSVIYYVVLYYLGPSDENDHLVGVGSVTDHEAENVTSFHGVVREIGIFHHEVAVGTETVHEVEEAMGNVTVLQEEVLENVTDVFLYKQK